MTEDKVPTYLSRIENEGDAGFGIGLVLNFFLGSCKDALWDWNPSQERVNGDGCEEECSQKDCQ